LESVGHEIGHMPLPSLVPVVGLMLRPISQPGWMDGWLG